eukprot:scaffold17457_cov76-Attheya_sp.AAC.1
MGESKYSEVPSNETSDVHFDGVLVQEVTPQTNTMNRDGNDCSEEESVRSQKRGAGVLCGVLGCLIGGPILAAVAAVGGAHATQKDGCIGDSARAFGDVALTAPFPEQQKVRVHRKLAAIVPTLRESVRLALVRKYDARTGTLGTGRGYTGIFSSFCKNAMM